MAESAGSDTWAMTSGGKRDLNALVAFALASDPEHGDTTDRTDVPDGHDAIGFQIDKGNIRQSQATRAASGHRHDVKR